MERTRESTREAATAGRPPAAPGGLRQPGLDLDRLVWDPEYREAMRPWLRQAG